MLSVPLSDTCTKALSQVDADRCYRYMNFHVGNVGRGRHGKLEKNVNELQTNNDVSRNLEA